MDNPCVRFDDLTVGGFESFGLVGQVETLVAKRLDEVVRVIEEAEKAAASGYWVAGFLSYEAAPAFNSDLTVRPAGLHDPLRELPLAHFQVFSTRIELDRVDSLHFPPGAYNVSGWSPDASRRDYRDSLAMTGRALMSGEISRGAHTFRLHAAFNGDPAALYRDLIRSQRAPHAACIDTGRYRLLSASPERFFKRTGDLLTVNPVLAAVRRGRWQDEDQQLAAVLSAEAETTYSNRSVVKEIEAELAEIGDLAPIALQDRLNVERLETLWHLTARIGVTLRPGIGLLDILNATFPPVSVTGVPKAEAMRLIATTEDSPRGVYCGTIGFLSPTDADGPAASFSVAIRTVVVDREEGVAEYGVGGAITNSSDVISAYEEARLKARVLVDRRPEFQLVEEFRTEGGVIRAMDAKIDHLLDSAAYFGFEIDRSALLSRLRDIARAPDPRHVTVYVDRSGNVEMETRPAPPWSEEPGPVADLRGAVAEATVSPDNVFLFHNTTDTRLSDVFRRDYPDTDVIILVNEHDEVAGALQGGIAILRDGVWYTPPRGSGARCGGLRSRLIDTSEVVVRVVTRGQLERAEQVALLDDIGGWRTVALVG